MGTSIANFAVVSYPIESCRIGDSAKQARTPVKLFRLLWNLADVRGESYVDQRRLRCEFQSLI